MKEGIGGGKDLNICVMSKRRKRNPLLTLMVFYNTIKNVLGYALRCNTAFVTNKFDFPKNRSEQKQCSQNESTNVFTIILCFYVDYNVVTLFLYFYTKISVVITFII